MSETASATMIDRLRLALNEFRAEGWAARSALAESGSATDPYATVDVARDGHLVDIRFTDRVLKATPPIVGRSILALYEQARATAQRGEGLVARATHPATPEPTLQGGDRFVAALRRADTGTDALLAASPFPRLAVGPGFNDQMHARHEAKAVELAAVQAELAAVRTTATSDIVEVEVGAGGVLLAVRVRARGPGAGPVTLRQSFLDTLAEATAAARAEVRRTLAGHGLLDPSRS